VPIFRFTKLFIFNNLVLVEAAGVEPQRFVENKGLRGKLNPQQPHQPHQTRQSGT
jgi:hypothetical protein